LKLDEMSALLDELAGAGPVLLLDAELAPVHLPGLAFCLAGDHARTPPDVRVAADAPCYIYFTSGSTGVPKAILGRTGGLAHFIQWEIAEFAMGRGTRGSQLTITSF